ncbi:MAG: Omp28-related outer membrane protein [Flavobacteriaceae bacterium]|nr:Omp28-related outer membrane protein [Flavobacteriaceae bacterium]
MKQKSLSALLIAFASAFAFGQTIVNTSPENKKVILEEFTGIHCVFCPDGHAIAQGIKSNYPDDFFIINVHQGSFSVPGAGEPDFRTPYGNAIAGQSGLVGYPAGTINRHYFPGQSQSGGNDTAMSRGQWGATTVETLGLASYLNMAVEAEVDIQNSEITVHVEAYYTGNSPEATNMLNVALLQNNTLGPQTGGNAGNNYVHQHRLVELITGQWGESISPTTTGTFIDRTYTYSVPAMYNNVPVNLEDLEVVVFMTETTQEIISGNGALPTFVNLLLDDDASLAYEQDINGQCGLDFLPEVTIQNRGNNPLTSLDITYSINGGASQSYTWTGNLGPFESAFVPLNPISYPIQATNTINVSIPNDEDNTNNNASNTFVESSVNSTQYVTLLMNTDNNGEETSWVLRGPSGIIAEGNSYGNNQNINETFSLTEQGCHEFRIYDSGGNGSSSLVLYDSNNTVLLQSSGNYGSGTGISFETDGFFGIVDNNLNKVSIYPNPAKSVVTITNAENANVIIYDLIGKIVATQSNIAHNQEIGISHLHAGTYFVKIVKEGQTTVERLIISK